MTFSITRLAGKTLWWHRGLCLAHL